MQVPADSVRCRPASCFPHGASLPRPPVAGGDGAPQGLWQGRNPNAWGSPPSSDQLPKAPPPDAVPLVSAFHTGLWGRRHSVHGKGAQWLTHAHGFNWTTENCRPSAHTLSKSNVEITQCPQPPRPRSSPCTKRTCPTWRPREAGLQLADRTGRRARMDPRTWARLPTCPDARHDIARPSSAPNSVRAHLDP